MARGFFEVHGDRQTVATAITLLTVAMPATGIAYVDRVWLQQNTVTAVGTRAVVRILRKTAAITSTATPPTPVSTDSTASSGATIAWIATAEGTDGNVLIEEEFDYVPGWLWTPASAKERIWIPPSGILGIKFPVAPTSASWTFGIGYEEYA